VDIAKAKGSSCATAKYTFAQNAKATGSHVARQLKPCGTPAAYARHYKKGETPCQLCRDAINAAQRERTARQHQFRAAGYKTGLIIDQIVSGRTGKWVEHYVRDANWEHISSRWVFRPWYTSRNGPYPHYKWEHEEVREYILPMQDVLKQLFPYNCEKPKPCKCCDGTGIRRA
jgi:hypothetical protein